MTFHTKHPYLFSQLIGFGFLIFAFAYMMFHLDGLQYDYQYILFVLSVIIGVAMITISPPVIFLQRRSLRDKEKNKWIYELQTRKHMWADITIAFLVIGIFLITTMFFAFYGLFFLLPFAVFPAAAVYFLYRYLLKKRFYKIPDAEQYCIMYQMLKPDGLSLLEQTPTLAYFNVVPNTENLELLYNFYNNCGALKQTKIHIICIRFSLLNERYGELFDESDRMLFCVSSQDIDINELSSLCFADRVVLYDKWIGKLLELRQIHKANTD